MSPSTILVTGASGFVGSAVIRQLLQRDYRVHALTHSRPLPTSDPRLQSFPQSDLPQALVGVSAVIHLVGIIAEDPARDLTFHRIHVDLTRTVVDACVQAGVQRYLHMSALGARPDSPSAYHQTKAGAEQIVTASPLSWTIFRPSLIHGSQGEFTHILCAWTRGQKAPWFCMPYFGAGPLGLGRKSLVQPVHVDDVARLFVDALTKTQTIGRRYDVVGAQQLTWPAMYRVFSQALRGRPKATLPIPAWYALLLTRLLPPRLLPFNRAQVIMSQEDSVADPAALEHDFGFVPQGFTQSLAHYVAELKC